jgi:hypothetical protein
MHRKYLDTQQNHHFISCDYPLFSVRFGDCTERWSSFFELRRLGDPEEEEEDEGEEEEEGETSEQPSPPKSRLEEEEQEPPVELPQHVIEARQQLSYDFESLVWDSAHHRNETETYCYCGESGDWSVHFVCNN